MEFRDRKALVTGGATGIGFATARLLAREGAEVVIASRNIEATLSQNVRTCGPRRTRYRGLPKTHVQHVLTGLPCNVTRIADWIADPTRTRRAPSHFRALCTATG